MLASARACISPCLHQPVLASARACMHDVYVLPIIEILLFLRTGFINIAGGRPVVGWSAEWLWNLQIPERRCLWWRVDQPSTSRSWQIRVLCRGHAVYRNMDAWRQRWPWRRYGDQFGSLRRGTEIGNYNFIQFLTNLIQFLKFKKNKSLLLKAFLVLWFSRICCFITSEHIRHNLLDPRLCIHSVFRVLSSSIALKYLFQRILPWFSSIQNDNLEIAIDRRTITRAIYNLSRHYKRRKSENYANKWVIVTVLNTGL